MSNALLKATKRRSDVLLGPVMKQVNKLCVHPHGWTFFSFLSGVLAVVFLQKRIYFIVFCVLSLVFDIVDGHLARYSKRDTILGKWLDYSSDRSIEFLLIVFAPISNELRIFVLTLFLLHQLLFIFVVDTVFFGRTVLMLFFALNLFNIGSRIVLGVYGVGILWQLRKFLRKKAKNEK